MLERIDSPGRLRPFPTNHPVNKPDLAPRWTKSGILPRTLAALSGLLLLPVLSGCRPTPSTGRCGGQTMGTTWSLTSIGRATDGSPVQAELDRLERIFSTWREDSEVSRFNRHPSDVPFEVSPELLSVVTLARDIHHRSGGAFDPTVGPLVAAAGFGPPSLADASARPDFGMIEADPSSGTLRKQRQGVMLDLSAVAKGYAVDAIAKRLAAAGHDNFLLEIGGELRACGRGPDGDGWTVGVQDPSGAAGRTTSTVILRDESIATSGTYLQRGAEPDGSSSHIIDPRTRQPVGHGTVSVTVIAPDAARADGWATALLVLGREAGREIADREGLEALFLEHAPGRAERTQEANTLSPDPLDPLATSGAASSLPSDSGIRSK